MNYYFDTEYLDQGHRLQLLSIGIVSEDGREYYAQHFDVDYRNAKRWIRDNVLVHFDNESWRLSKEIRLGVKEFLGADHDAVLWAFQSSKDWQCLEELVYSRDPYKLRPTCRDLEKLARGLGYTSRALLPKQEFRHHHALEDARWNKLVHDHILLNGSAPAIIDEGI